MSGHVYILEKFQLSSVAIHLNLNKLGPNEDENNEEEEPGKKKIKSLLRTQNGQVDITK